MVKLSKIVKLSKNFLDLGGSIFFFNGLVRPPTLNFLYFFLAIMVPYGPNINVSAFPRFFFLKVAFLQHSNTHIYPCISFMYPYIPLYILMYPHISIWTHI